MTLTSSQRHVSGQPVQQLLEWDGLVYDGQVPLDAHNPGPANEETVEACSIYFDHEIDYMGAFMETTRLGLAPANLRQALSLGRIGHPVVALGSVYLGVDSYNYAMFIDWANARVGSVLIERGDNPPFPLAPASWCFAAVRPDNRHVNAAMALAPIKQSETLAPELARKIACLSVSNTIEAVALMARQQDDQLAVLMIRCPADAPAYAGLWHIPYSYQHTLDDEAETLQRLGQDAGSTITSAKMIGRSYERFGEFGATNHTVIATEFGKNPKGGRWWPIDRLPENTVRHHREVVIPAAVAHHTGDTATLERLLPTKII